MAMQKHSMLVVKKVIVCESWPIFYEKVPSMAMQKHSMLVVKKVIVCESWPIFYEKVPSMAIEKHFVVKKVIERVNPGQVPV